MATVFEDLVIDRVLEGIFQQSDNTIIGAMNQLENLSINTSSETKDKTDARGVLIKRFFTAKAVEVTGENSVVSLSTLGLQFGAKKMIASADEKLQLPSIQQYVVNATDKKFVIKMGNKNITPVEGTVAISGVTASGLPDTSRQFTKVTAFSDSETALEYTIATAGDVTTVTLSDGAFANDATSTRIQIIYDYMSSEGVSVTQSGNKFPNSCKFTLSVVVVDPCDKEVLRHAYIVFPSFQVSPDVDWSLATDATQPFTGTAQLDYCSVDKKMFYIALDPNDVEEDDE